MYNTSTNVILFLCKQSQSPHLTSWLPYLPTYLSTYLPTYLHYLLTYLQVCELRSSGSGDDRDRDCVVTRGCATQDQCAGFSANGTFLTIPGSSQYLGK